MFGRNFPFRLPMSSFAQPVVSPSTDPDTGSQISVTFGADWLPYILGALRQLTLVTTWAGTEAEILLAQQRAELLLLLFDGGTAMALEFEISDGVLRWRATGAEDWTEIGAVTGPTGEPGEPGEAAECEDCPPIIRRDPRTGHYQWSTDDITFYEFPDGPWVDASPGVATIAPPPRLEATLYDRKCAAAVNAAYMIREVHRGLAAHLGEEYTTMVDEATAIGAYLFSIGTVLGIASWQPEVGLTAMAVLIAIAVQFNTNALTDEDEERLKCLLLDAASDSADTITFDFNAFWGAIDLDDPKQTNVREMLTILGPDALNFMGAQSIASGDCDECSEGWCYTFDFTEDDGDFAVSGGEGAYDGTGWHSAQVNAGGGDLYQTVNISRGFTETTITDVEVVFSLVEGAHVAADSNTSFGVWTISAFSGALVNMTANNYPSSPWVWAGSVTRSFLRVLILAGHRLDNVAPGGLATITSITLRGTGDNPFGADNC